MKLPFVIFLYISIVAIHTQAQSIKSVFKSNFYVLDSVVSCKKKQNDFSKEQTAFLYIVNEWSGAEIPFDHNNGFRIDKKSLSTLKHWYKKNVRHINPADYFTCLDIYKRFFNGGVLPDADWKTLDTINKKYKIKGK